MKPIFHFLFISLLSVISSFSFAEQKIVQGLYEVHYSVFPSTSISPEVAAAYKLNRSKYRGLVNITPQIKNSDGITQGLKVKVSGQARNLLANQQNLEFKEIIECSVIYYLAEFSYSNEEQFNFKMEVIPDNSNETMNINFDKKFYVD